jgi:hypothetical protein
VLHNAFAIDYTQWLESLLDTLSDEMIEYDARDNEAGDLVTYQATLGEYVGSLEDSDHFDSILGSCIFGGYFEETIYSQDLRLTVLTANIWFVHKHNKTKTHKTQNTKHKSGCQQSCDNSSRAKLCHHKPSSK